jgi:hypothetical protein
VGTFDEKKNGGGKSRATVFYAEKMCGHFSGFIFASMYTLCVVQFSAEIPCRVNLSSRQFFPQE